MLAHGKAIGCEEAWVGTEPDNLPARGLYEQRRKRMPKPSRSSCILRADGEAEVERRTLILQEHLRPERG